MKTFLPITTLLMLLFCSSICQGQHLWQSPKPLVSKSHLQKIIGPVNSQRPSRPIHILWVWGYDKGHRPGAHDYLRVRDLFEGLLNNVPDVTVETVYGFPSKEQFDQSDLTVFFLHLPQLSAKQYADFQMYVHRGGGVVALHETAIMRPAAQGKKLAKCLGMAWDEGRSQWGAVFEDITIKTSHEIFQGFPQKLRMMDEFYWDLNQIVGVDVLGTVRTGTPGNSITQLPSSKLSVETSPVFWTLSMGKGRVFGTTLGHNTFSYYDPEYRIILFRAMAWAIKEKPDPFMRLVTEGITNDKGMVGITHDMRNWKGKLREPPVK